MLFGILYWEEGIFMESYGVACKQLLIIFGSLNSKLCVCMCTKVSCFRYSLQVNGDVPDDSFLQIKVDRVHHQQFLYPYRPRFVR